MKQLLKTALVVLFTALTTLSYASNYKHIKSKRKPLSKVTTTKTPTENTGNGESKNCKIPGLLTIYPNNIYHCHLVSANACVFVPCSQTGTIGPIDQGGTFNLPSTVDIPEGQNYIGYYDENNVFKLQYVNSMSITRDPITNDIIISAGTNN